MSAEKAIETNDGVIYDDGADESEAVAEEEIVTEDVEIIAEAEVEADADDDGEVEIVVEGEEEPSSKPVPKGFIKRINKLNGKVEAANTEADEANRRAEVLEQELKLYRMKNDQPSAPVRPKPGDFDSDTEYEAALDQYDEVRLTAIADQRFAQQMQASQTQATQADSNQALESNLKAHYKRAELLKVSDYEDTEDKAIEILGNDTAKQIMANTGNSEMLLYHLGKNPVKAQKLAQLIQTNPLKGVVEIGGLAVSLRAKPKHSPAPNPETRIDKGSASSSGEARGVVFS